MKTTKKELLYSTAATHKEQIRAEAIKHIYLGNLRHIGNGKLVGNVYLDPFLNIPDKFISESKKTGKRVVRIVVEENKNGTDMFGLTHTIRVDQYILKQIDEVSENKNIERDGLIFHKLGISESEIANQNDRDILKNWKVAIDKEIRELSIKKDVKINNGKLDNNTYLKIMTAIRICGTLSQQIQLRCSEIKKENHSKQELRFSQIAKEILPTDVFNSIIEKLKTQ